MSAQEQSWGVTHKPRPSTALPAPVTAVLGSAGLGPAALLTLAGGLNLWAVDTLGYATSGTFPSGGPQLTLGAGGGLIGRPPSAPPTGFGLAGGPRGMQLFGRPGPGGPPGGTIGAPLGDGRTIARAIAYAKAHGGGTVAVSSQSSAASAIVGDDADVAGIGGFSGRESDVSVAWLTGEVSHGKIRWVLAEATGSSGPRLPGDTRQGSRKAMTAVTQACTKVTLSSSANGGESASAGGQGSEGAPYDCKGHAAALVSGA